MLSCLENANTKLEKIEKEYPLFNFQDFGVKMAFMQLTKPLSVQAMVFLKILNKDSLQDASMQYALQRCPDTYIPKYEEVAEHSAAVTDFIFRTQRLLKRFTDKFDQDPLSFLGLVVEGVHMMQQQPLVETATPKPQVLLLEQSKKAKETEVAKVEIDDVGVSFFKNRGCFNKKR